MIAGALLIIAVMLYFVQLELGNIRTIMEGKADDRED